MKILPLSDLTILRSGAELALAGECGLLAVAGEG